MQGVGGWGSECAGVGVGGWGSGCVGWEAGRVSVQGV